MALLTPLGLAAALSADVTPHSTSIEEISVIGRRLDLTGTAISASEGEIGPDEIGAGPLLRTGDLMEMVPGMVATQHSGSGKANQYFLRGFNLDHGTDFATFVDSMPVNMRTHGHGQGYSDLNFVIPETVGRLRYRKGPYYADVGDFSSAGTAAFTLADSLPRGIAELSVGEYGWRRGVIADSREFDTENTNKTFFYAAEWQTYAGPWSDIDEDVNKLNLFARLSGKAGAGNGRLTAMRYDNQWNSPDQIPARAVSGGVIGRYGSIDSTPGGETQRRSLSASWVAPLLGGEFRSSAYAMNYRLELWSNFTYRLDNPDDGDQFEQFDDRDIYGFDVAQRWQGEVGDWRLGIQGRFDNIDQVGLYRTHKRTRLSTVREDSVQEDSLAIYADWQLQLTESLRSYLGLRYDHFEFDVAASLPQNSGKRSDAASSLKASLAWRPLAFTEFYASYGQGLHSNDARGTTIMVDPNSGDLVEPVDPLVDSKGGELGVRLYLTDKLHSTLAFWQLDLESELLFVGDAGTTEASRPSERSGAELGIYWFASEQLNAEVELAYTKAGFSDRDFAGNDIPGAIPQVASAAVNYRGNDGWFAALNLRHFGPYPLIEDGSVKSDGSAMVNLRVGRELQRWRLQLDLLNLLDSDDHDIDYFYASRMPGEAASGVEDIHYHIFEPRSVRASVRFHF